MNGNSTKFVGDTSKFKVKDIIYDNYDFAVARGHWDGSPTLRLACRWHNNGRDMGYPQTFGKPQWMMFPEDIKAEIANILDDPAASKIVITLEPPEAASSEQS